jgi:hypothetical protein
MPSFRITHTAKRTLEDGFSAIFWTFFLFLITTVFCMPLLLDYSKECNEYTCTREYSNGHCTVRINELGGTCFTGTVCNGAKDFICYIEKESTSYCNFHMHCPLRAVGGGWRVLYILAFELLIIYYLFFKPRVSFSLYN